MTSQTSLME